MRIVKIRGSINSGEYYFAFQIKIAGEDCLFRMPEAQYFDMAKTITGMTGIDDEPDHDDPRIKKVFEDTINAVTSSENLAHEIWAAAQLLPDEGIEDGVNRIIECLQSKELQS